jgi:hemin uptake protein HemP
MSAAGDKDEGRGGGEVDRKSTAIERRLTIVNNLLQSRDLFVGTNEIVIVHGRDSYHLRLTAQNKLILTK